MTMLARIKLALRITHDQLDNEIAETIASARAELVRAGVLNTVASDDNNALVNQAVKSYCLANLSNNKEIAQGHQKAFESIMENLRKSKNYGYIVETQEEQGDGDNEL